MTKTDAIVSLKQLLKHYEPRYERYRGWLKAIDGSVHVSDKPGYVYVQRRDTASGTQVEEMRMPNVNVPDIDGYPVILGRDHVNRSEEIILQRDMDTLLDHLFDYITRAHADQHEADGGFDVVYVYERAVIPLRVSAQITPDLTIRVLEGWAPSTSNQNQYFSGNTSVSLSADIPVSGQCWIAVSYNIETGAITTTPGSTIPLGNTLSFDDIPDIPDNNISLAVILAYQGQSSIIEDNIRDTRALSAVATNVAELSEYTRGYIFRGGATDWEVYDASNDGYILIGDGTDTISVAVSQDVDLANDGAATVTGIQGRNVVSTAPVDGQVYVWNGTASQWEPQAGGSGGGGVARATPATTPRWHIDGYLDVYDEVDGVWRLMQGFEIQSVIVYLKGTGSASSTIIDVEKSVDGGVIWTSIFSNPANRPEISAGGAHTATGTPTTVSTLSTGTLLRTNIDQVATGAYSIDIQLYGESGSAVADDLTNLGCG